MPDRKLDRRAERSRDLLLEAMRVLMVERGYDRFTVQDVLDHAGVGRATFYAHFQNKEDLLIASVNRLKSALKTVWSAPAGGGERLGFTLAFFRHIDSHRRIYYALLGRKSHAMVEHHIRRILKELVREDFVSRRVPRRNAVPLDATVEYVVGALWSMIVWWLETKSPATADEMNALFQRLTFPGLEVLAEAAR